MIVVSCNKELPEKVSDIIIKHGVKKTWIAEQLGISNQHVNNILAKKNITIDDANKILNLIGYKASIIIEHHSTFKRSIRKMMNDKIIDIRDIDVIVIQKDTGGKVIFEKDGYLGDFVSEVVLDYLDNEIVEDSVINGLYQIKIC